MIVNLFLFFQPPPGSSIQKIRFQDKFSDQHSSYIWCSIKLDEKQLHNVQRRMEQPTEILLQILLQQTVLKGSSLRWSCRMQRWLINYHTIPLPLSSVSMILLKVAASWTRWMRTMHRRQSSVHVRKWTNRTNSRFATFVQICLPSSFATWSPSPNADPIVSYDIGSATIFPMGQSERKSVVF